MVMMLASAQGAFKYLAGHSRAGQLNEDADRTFKAWQMPSVEGDLMTDTMQLQGPGDNEEEKPDGAPFAVPDTAPQVWIAFGDATAAQVRNHLSRKCSEVATVRLGVSSMVQDMKSGDFNPDLEGLGTWFGSLHRKHAKIKNAFSLREFFEMIEDLLLGEEGLCESTEAKRYPPASVSEAVSNFAEVDKRPLAIAAVQQGRGQQIRKYHPKGLEAAFLFEVSIDPKGLQTQRVSKVLSCVQIQIETKGHTGRG